MPVLSMIVCAALLLVMQWLVLMFHECGHVIGAKLGGLAVRQVRIGSRTDRPLVFRAFGVRWIVHAWTLLPRGGMTYLYARTRRPWRIPKLVTSLAGPCGTLLALTLLFGAYCIWRDAWPHWFRWSYLGGVTFIGVFHALMNLVITWSDPKGDLRQACLAVRLNSDEIDELLATNEIVNRMTELGELLLLGRATDDEVASLLNATAEHPVLAWGLHTCRIEPIAENHGWRAALDFLESAESRRLRASAEAAGLDDNTQFAACWIQLHLLARLEDAGFAVAALESGDQVSEMRRSLAPDGSAHEADALAAIAALEGDLRRARDLFPVSVRRHNADWETLAQRLCWLALAEARAGSAARAERLLGRARRHAASRRLLATFAAALARAGEVAATSALD